MSCGLCRASTTTGRCWAFKGIRHSLNEIKPPCRQDSVDQQEERLFNHHLTASPRNSSRICRWKHEMTQEEQVEFETEAGGKQFFPWPISGTRHIFAPERISSFSSCRTNDPISPRDSKRSARGTATKPHSTTGPTNPMRCLLMREKGIEAAPRIKAALDRDESRAIRPDVSHDSKRNRETL
jgi:hypothetical protein